MKTHVIIPAYNSARTIQATVRALTTSEIDHVIVVDDGSTDATATLAGAAGAVVVRKDRNAGMGGAWQTGFETQVDNGPPDMVLMVDADTGESAKGALKLLTPVASGEASMAIGILPSAGGRGGFGTVRRLATLMIRAACGFDAIAPLSGQRAFTREVGVACSPFAKRFGCAAALTTDAVRQGFKVVETPVDMDHEHTGRTYAGFLHRAKQGYYLVVPMIPRLLKSRRA